MPEFTISELLGNAAEQDPHAPAIIEGDSSTSYGELDESVSALARGLRELGLNAGDRLGILAPNSLLFVQAYFAGLRADAVVVPVNALYTPREVAALISSSDARVLVVHESLADVARAAVADLDDGPLVVVAGDAEGGEVSWGDVPRDGDRPTPERGGDDLAVLLYTSGTTSSPRAAMLSHRALLSNLDQVMSLEPKVIGSSDVLLGAIPFFHVYGLNFVLGIAVRAGASLVLMSSFDASESLRLVREHRISVALLVPRIVAAWSAEDTLRKDLRSVRLAISGAAALPTSLIGEFQTATGITLHQGYGLTEAAPVVTSTLASPEVKAGSIGRPLPGIEVKLVDEGGNEVEEDDPGELIVRGDNLFKGYWPDRSGGPDADGWWNTGDVCYADPDGDLFLVDRTKDLIIVNGFNVYPSEVEEVLSDIPDVREAVVVASPHPVTGETVKAFLKLASGSSVTTDDVLDHCEARLARFKRPTIVEFAETLPTTSTGKVARGQLREADKVRSGIG
jgi:long-chain acyl-CoA synthetase